MRPVNPLTLFRVAAAAALLLVMANSLAVTSVDDTYAQTTVRATRTPTLTPYPRTGTTRPTLTPTPDRLNGLGGSTDGSTTGGTSGALANDEVSGVIVGIDTTSNPPRVLVQTDTATPPTYANDPALMPGTVLVYISDASILPGLGLGMEITFGGTAMTLATSQGLYANQVLVDDPTATSEDPYDPYSTDPSTDPYEDPYAADNYTYDNYGTDNYEYDNYDYDSYADNYDYDNYDYDNYDYDNYDDNYDDNFDDGSLTETTTTTITTTTTTRITSGDTSTSTSSSTTSRSSSTTTASGSTTSTTTSTSARSTSGSTASTTTQNRTTVPTSPGKPNTSRESPPAPPSELQVVEPSRNRVALRWKDQSKDENGFRVDLFDNGQRVGRKLLAKDSTGFTFENLKPNTKYRVHVQSFREVNGQPRILSPISKADFTTKP